MTGLLVATTDCCAPRGAARVKLAKITDTARKDAVCFDTMMRYPSLYFPIDKRSSEEVARK
jgi:hypothetical protein